KASGKLEDLRAEFASHDRGRGQHAVRLAGEMIEPASDRLPDALRDRDAPPRHVAGSLKPPVRREEVDDLAHEERVSLCLAVDGGYEALRRLDPRRHLDEARDVRLGEPAEKDALAQVRTRELGEAPREGMVAAHFRIAIGRDHQEPAFGELARHE